MILIDHDELPLNSLHQKYFKYIPSFERTLVTPKQFMTQLVYFYSETFCPTEYEANLGCAALHVSNV